jgi:general secretion pathway protein D
MPPDLQRRQLSSVVTVKDGTRIILGGLINTRKSKQINKVPILGDIPIINYLFKWEENIKITQELVIILEPHIIKNAKNDVSLKDLGYEEYEDNSAMSNDKSLDDIVDRALVRDKKEDDDN